MHDVLADSLSLRRQPASSILFLSTHLRSLCRRLIGVVREETVTTYYVDGFPVRQFSPINATSLLTLPSQGFFMCAF